jgi:hypothetical protein
MKEEILQIASDLREGHITSNEAKAQLLRLFGVSGQLPPNDCQKCGNVRALPKLGILKYKSSHLALMLNRKTKVQLTTSAPILAMQC